MFSWFTARRVQPLHHRHHKRGRPGRRKTIQAPRFTPTGAALPGRRRGRLGFRTTEQGTRRVQPPEVRDAERAACRVWRGRQSAARPSDVFSETSLADDRPRQKARAGRTAVSSLAATTRGSRWSGQAGQSRGGQRAFPVCRCPDPTPQPANRSGRESNPHPPSSFDGVPPLNLRSERAARSARVARQLMHVSSTWAGAELSARRPADAFIPGGGFPARCRDL